jgi:maltooligosyltrehalose trehalohydrolase
MATSSAGGRAFPIGAELSGEGASFRVWAPGRHAVELVVEAAAQGRIEAALSDEGDGYFSAIVAGVQAGALYRFRIDGSDGLYPDPASRSQPEGPHGPSALVDAGAFAWTDGNWQGLSPTGQIIYELHLGTFTKAGTVQAAIAELEELAVLGITVVELMPIADFPGNFGWGYDGVNLFAPCRLYGTPDDYRQFVNHAHALGVGVILDVVYNHFGPEGNYLSAFTGDYFSGEYDSEWGQAINFDGRNSAGVREFFVANAAYWVAEYHFDGFRFDATHAIVDASPTHILAELGHAARTAAAGRRLLLVAENEPQDIRHVRRLDDGGYGCDGLWNDDLHHALTVRLTGRSEAYYSDYGGTVQEFVSAFKWGFLYQGQRYSWQKKRRGTPTFGVAPSSFVNFLQNHDQIANSGCGLRIHALTSPGLLRAATAMILLGPGTPMLFQGQEFAAQAPFLYFADLGETLAPAIAQGRREFLAQFPSFVAAALQSWVNDPTHRETFERCKLDGADRVRNWAIYELHKDLIRLRREDAVLGGDGSARTEGAVLADDVFVVRYFARAGSDDYIEVGDRLLIVNFGIDWRPSIVPEPLLAPPPGMRWNVAWSSEEPVYGGGGVLPCEKPDASWFMQGSAAAFLVALRDWK